MCVQYKFPLLRHDLSKAISWTTVKKCIQLFVSVFFHWTSSLEFIKIYSRKCLKQKSTWTLTLVWFYFCWESLISIPDEKPVYLDTILGTFTRPLDDLSDTNPFWHSYLTNQQPLSSTSQSVIDRLFYKTVKIQVFLSSKRVQHNVRSEIFGLTYISSEQIFWASLIAAPASSY